MGDWRNETNLAYLEQFKLEVSSYLLPYHTDDYLFRWIKAKDFKISKCATFFIDAMKWRQENEIDTLVERLENEQYILELSREGPVSSPGQFLDFDGWPVYFRRVVDTKRLLKKYGEEKFTNWHIFLQEKMERFNRELVENNGGWSRPARWVVDLGDLSMKHVDGKVKHAFKHITRIYDQYYPESVSAFYVVNAPGIFDILWRLAKGVVDKTTAKKVNVTSESGYDILVRFMREEDIPSFCGGELVGVAGDLGDDKLIYFQEDSDCEKIEIEAGSKYEYPFEVEDLDSFLGWKLVVEEYDVDILIKSNESIQDLGRHKENQGHFVPREKGSYIFILDNSYSEVHPKSITIDLKLETSEKILSEQ